jgi:hypothetical protein
MTKTTDKDKKVRKSKGLKLNIIPSKEKISQEESDRRLIEFFSLLYEWHLDEQNKLEPTDKA